MDGAQYPTDEAVDELAHNPEVVAEQVLFVAENFPERVREFIFDAAVAVSQEQCHHTHAAAGLPEGLSVAQRRQAAADHGGLCGVFHAATIAGVETQKVADRGDLTHNRFRNQVSRETANVSYCYSCTVRIWDVAIDCESTPCVCREHPMLTVVAHHRLHVLICWLCSVRLRCKFGQKPSCKA